MTKAKCECMKESGDENVFAIKDGSFSFLTRWGMVDILMHLSLALITSGVWVVGVLVWNIGKITNPPYHCNKCDAVIEKDQFVN